MTPNTFEPKLNPMPQAQKEREWLNNQIGAACQQNIGSGIRGLHDVSDFHFNLNRRIDEAVGAAHSADKLIELRGLLDRNPETARILELMREMGI